MIKIIHKNKDLETLIKKGESTTYKDVSKKAFIKSLRAFILYWKSLTKQRN